MWDINRQAEVLEKEVQGEEKRKRHFPGRADASRFSSGCGWDSVLCGKGCFWQATSMMLRHFTEWAGDVSMRAGVGSPGRTDKAGRVLLWGRAQKDSVVDNPRLKPRGCLHNGEVGKNAKGIWEGISSNMILLSPVGDFKKKPLGTSAKNTKLIPLYYRRESTLLCMVI